MDDTTFHRKLVKYYNVPRVAHELTWSCYERRPLLCTSERRTLITEAIRRASERLGYAVLAFVVMPEHVHLLVRHPGEAYDISELLYAIKRPSSYHFKQVMLAAADPVYPSLIVQERPGKKAFRFWQEGPGYDRNMLPDTLNTAVRYLHLKPVRARLCARAVDWEWSSARWYEREALRPDGGIDWGS